MIYYPYIIAFHIIFIVTWFAALFYIVRLFIYHVEALNKAEPDKSILARQFLIMEKRLMNIIGTPSMVLVLITGISLLIINQNLLTEGWMHVKLFFVACIITYHFICLKIMHNLSLQKPWLTSQQLRLFNELATIFLFVIVFLVELKNMAKMWAVFCGIILLGIILIIAVKLYKRSRMNKMRQP